MTPATFAQRALGRAIDMFIVFALTGLALAPFIEKADDGGVRNSAPLVFVAVVALALVAYEVIPVHLRGQTPGKVIARTKIVREDGSLPTVKQALVRWGIVVAVLVLGSPLGIIALVAIAALYLSALADPGGRSVLDKLAGTRVVRVRQSVEALDRR